MRFIVFSIIIISSISSITDARTIEANSSNIAAAFGSATGGDEIVLSGQFGWTQLSNLHFSSTVTVDASAATFSNSWKLSNISNLTVIGGTFGSAVAATRLGKAVAVYGGTNVSFTGGTYLGARGGGGLSVSNADGVIVANNKFTNLSVAGSLTGVTGLTLSNNSVAGARKDGFDIASSHDVVASHNSCTSGNPGSGAHPDCIQLWSIRGEAPTSNIQILDNYASGSTQGFTFFDHGAGGADDMVFAGNVIMSTTSIGIACNGCRDSSFIDNLLVTLRAAPHWTNLDIGHGTNIIKTGNVLTRTGVVDPYHPTIGQLGYGAGVLPSLTGSGHFADPELAQRFTGIALFNDSPDSVGTIPDAPTWYTLIAGFGLLGLSMRRWFGSSEHRLRPPAAARATG